MVMATPIGRTIAFPLLKAEEIEPSATIHLDAAANTPPTAAVKAAVAAALDAGANPASAHAAGDHARTMMTTARDAVAELCDGVFGEDVVFTSGCTEANNLVVGTARAMGATLVTTSVEHPSILRPAEALAASGGSILVLPVEGSGTLSLESLERALDTIAGPIVLSVQAANSETGVVQPLAEVAALVATRSEILFHSDAAQAFGKGWLSVGPGGPDVVSVSAHKLHGPMGVGALLIRDGEERLHPLVLGGDQERGLRAGTQPLPLIAGFAAACRERQARMAADIARMASLRNRLEAGVRAALPGVAINGETGGRLPNISNLRFPGVDAMALLAHLDANGVLASQGSACHSRRPEPSPVLVAMGLSEDDAFASIRFSVSPLNSEVEIDMAVQRIVTAARTLGLRA